MSVDDGALLASSRTGIKLSVREYQSSCTGYDFRLTVIRSKTEHMVSGRMTVESHDHRESMLMEGGDIIIMVC